MRTLALVISLIALVGATSAVSATRPKRWQWTPEKMAARLLAAPYPFARAQEHMKKASCVGQGVGSAGRYTAFECKIAFGDINAWWFATIYTRVLPVGSGRFCVVATPPAFDGQRKAVPYKAGTGGLSVLPSRACP